MGITFMKCSACQKDTPTILLSKERRLDPEEVVELGLDDFDSIFYHRCVKCLRAAAYNGELNNADVGDRNGYIQVRPALICALLVNGYNEGLKDQRELQAEVVAG